MKSRLMQAGLAIASLLIASVSANAADLPQPSYKAPAYTAPSYFSWSGFYVGGFGGYGFGDSTWSAAPAVSMEPSGALAGATLGYNFQTGTWVWGLEGDIAWSDMSDDVAVAGGTATTELTWLGTVRGRIGYAGWSNFLAYITGGAAFGNIDVTAPGREGGETAIGWTLGAGLEYALFSNWSVKAEYLYVDLGTIDFGPTEVDFTAHTIKAGLNYRF